MGLPVSPSHVITPGCQHYVTTLTLTLPSTPQYNNDINIRNNNNNRVIIIIIIIIIIIMIDQYSVFSQLKRMQKEDMTFLARLFYPAGQWTESCRARKMTWDEQYNGLLSYKHTTRFAF